MNYNLNTLIKRTIKVLSQNKEISDYSLNINKKSTTEMFYVLQKLETSRITDTFEILITIYKKNGENLGQASFMISHDINKKQIEELINQALYSASFVNNKYYDIVKGEKKIKKIKKIDKVLSVTPFEFLEKTANEFFNASFENESESIKFNSLELFFINNNVRMINSKGVNYEKETNEIMIEAIPSFTSFKTNYKTELYRMYRYNDVNDKLIERIKKAAKEAVEDCKLRSEAVSLNEVIKDDEKIVDVVLRDEDISNMLDEIISSYDYHSVYTESNMHKVGDMVQKDDSKNKITVKLEKISKEDFFDGEGVLLDDVTIIDKGKLVSYYGGNRFASYLGLKPTGSLPVIHLGKGNKSIDKIEKKNEKWIEVIDMSGIQVDLYQGYIGGEVRLAKYYDGKEIKAVSGFSFSGNLVDALNSIELSKEEIAIRFYRGPKYAKIKNMELN
ncbi:MAG: hypothetical protein IJS58_03770 [Bacilli bacterium]|nr:hypothetical protein [Bacilli bacterium]